MTFWVVSSTIIIELRSGLTAWRRGFLTQRVMRGLNTGELVFDACRVSSDYLVGPEGKGMRVSMAAISETGRGGMIGCGLGLQTACLEATAKFAQERILYGLSLIHI